MKVELVRARAADGMSLDGALNEPAPDAADHFPPLPFDGALLLHGVASNFYQPRLLQDLAEGLALRGLRVIRGNTRGHDTIHLAKTDDGARRQGAAFEIVDDCLLDIDAWLETLGKRDCCRVLLLGHSLGAIKAVYWQALRPAAVVAGLAAFSPPRLSASAFQRGAGRERYLESLARAREQLEAGTGERLLEVSFPFPMTMSAATFLDKYGAERYNVAQLAAKLTCPALFTYARRELSGPAFVDLPEDVRDASAEGRITVEIVDGADHSYHEFSGQLLDRLERCFPVAT